MPKCRPAVGAEGYDLNLRVRRLSVQRFKSAQIAAVHVSLREVSQGSCRMPEHKCRSAVRYFRNRIADAGQTGFLSATLRE